MDQGGGSPEHPCLVARRGPIEGCRRDLNDPPTVVVGGAVTSAAFAAACGSQTGGVRPVPPLQPNREGLAPRVGPRVGRRRAGGRASSCSARTDMNCPGALRPGKRRAQQRDRRGHHRRQPSERPTGRCDLPALPRRVHRDGHQVAGWTDAAANKGRKVTTRSHVLRVVVKSLSARRCSLFFVLTMSTPSNEHMAFQELDSAWATCAGRHGFAAREGVDPVREVGSSGGSCRRRGPASDRPSSSTTAPMPRTSSLGLGAPLSVRPLSVTRVIGSRVHHHPCALRETPRQTVPKARASPDCASTPARRAADRRVSLRARRRRRSLCRG